MIIQRSSAILSVFFAIGLLLCAGSAAAADLSNGQTLYVPAYSHIYHGDKGKEFDLTVTLSVRNVNLKDSIFVNAVDYYDSDGKLLRSYVPEAMELRPLVTIEYIVHEKDRTGGAGANFIVRWESPRPVNPPIVEAVMIGTSYSQGVSFVSVGREIEE